MPVADHAGMAFVEARKVSGSPAYTAGRPDGPPLWIVIHDQEAPETGSTAENAAAYFARGADGRSVSAHYVADNNSVIQCVKLGDSAWTVGNREGNNRGINWELAGYARQTRSEWLDAFGKAMFALIAPIIREDAAAFEIPLRLLTDEQVRAFEPGVTSHVQLGRVFGGSDHTDPGPNFPWDYFMNLLTGGNDGMAINDRVLLAPGNPDTADNIELQTKYKALGYDLGTSGPNGDGVDGSYGNNTKNATKAEQAKAGHAQTGSLDVKLWRILDAPPPPEPGPDPAPEPGEPVDYERIRTIVREEIDRPTAPVQPGE